MTTLDAWSTILSHGKPNPEGASGLAAFGNPGQSVSNATGEAAPTASGGAASVHFAPPSLMQGENRGSTSQPTATPNTTGFAPPSSIVEQPRQASPQHTSTVESPSSNVLWQSPVEKIGRNLQSHSRVAMVADSNLYVCLSAGGITRTVTLQSVQAISVVPPTVVQIQISSEPDLVLSMPSIDVRAGFLGAMERGRRELGAPTVDVDERPALSAEYGGSLLGPSRATPSASPENVPTTGASSGHHLAPSQASTGLSPEARVSGQTSGHMYDVAAAIQSHEDQPAAFSDRFNQRTKQIEDLKAAADSGLPVSTPHNIYNLQAQVDSQQQVIEELQRKSDDSRVVDELRRDLEHSRSLVTDLQTALRAQEGVFQEMIRGQEALKVAEDVKSSQEKQLNLMREEKKSWKQVIEGKDREIANLQDAMKLKEIEHEDELSQIRKAFAEYDANVATYLEGLRTGNANLHMPISSAAPHGYHTQAAPGLSGASATFAASVDGLGPALGGGVANPFLRGQLPIPSTAAGTEVGAVGGDQPMSTEEGQPQAESINVDDTSAFSQQDEQLLAAAQSRFGGHSSESESLQNSLVDRLNKYANRKYNLPHGHPAPGSVPANRYPVGYVSPPRGNLMVANNNYLMSRGGPGGVSFSPVHTGGVATPSRLRDRSIL